MDNKLLLLGAYAKGALDAAASRGIITEASLQTMVKAMINIYGPEHFNQEQGPVAQSKTDNLSDAIVTAISKNERIKEAIGEVSDNIKEHLTGVG